MKIIIEIGIVIEIDLIIGLIEIMIGIEGLMDLGGKIEMGHHITDVGKKGFDLIRIVVAEIITNKTEWEETMKKNLKIDRLLLNRRTIIISEQEASFSLEIQEIEYL